MADNVAIFVVFSFISSAAEAGLLRGGGLLTERFGGNRHSVDHILRTRLGVSEKGNSSRYFYKKAVLDHFASTLNNPLQYWSQRFYVDESQWGGFGYPCFLYIGGEGPQGPSLSLSLFIFLSLFILLQ
ncbi:hypothetical protein AAMO2058_001640400, partial [Amorphochlora amoebiformis]